MWRWTLHAFYVVTLALIGNSLWSGWDSIREMPWQIKPLLLLAALVFSLCYFVGRGLLWTYMMRSLDLPLSYHSGARMFVQAYVVRYLPGGFWPFVSIAASGHEAGLSKRVTTFALVMNTILVFWTSALLGLPLLYLIYPAAASWLVPALGGVLVVGFLLSLKLLPALLSTAMRRGWMPSHLNLARFSTTRNMLVLIGSMLVLNLLLLVSYLIGIIGLLGLPLAQAVYLALAYNFAWFVGLIILFVPQGIGVREGTFVLLSAAVLAHPVAVALSIAMRLLTALRDLLILIALVIRVPPG
jgi:hypothetical protein